MASVYSPRLPKEVWRNIFEFATHTPGELDTMYDQVTPYAMWDMLYESCRDIEASYKLRQTIVLVCRLWNEVGTPILYRSIVIRRLERTIPSLNAVLRPITRRNPLKFASPSFIRRLDININSGDWHRICTYQRNGFKGLEKFLLSLLKRTPMLRIFKIDLRLSCIAMVTHLDHFLKKLYECLPLSLKAFMIHLYVPKQMFENRTLCVNLPHHSLDTIILHTELPIAVFKVGNVRSLEIFSESFKIQNSSRINVPSALTTLRILDTSEDLECLKELGKQIESLEICEPRKEYRSPMYLEAIARYCTRLDTLAIRSWRWNGPFLAMRSSSFSPLGIRRLGYNLEYSLVGEKQWNRTFDLLKDVCRSKSLPNLKEFFICGKYELWTMQKDVMIHMQSQARSLYEVTGVKTFYKHRIDQPLIPFCSF